MFGSGVHVPTEQYRMRELQERLERRGLQETGSPRESGRGLDSVPSEVSGGRPRAWRKTVVFNGVVEESARHDFDTTV